MRKRYPQKLPVENFKPNQPAFDYFWWLIYARQYIWYMRFVVKHPGPWTDDPVLSTYRFTNVYRELDRGTDYLLTHILGKAAVRLVIFNIIVYRFFNSWQTYHEDIGFITHWDYQLYSEKLLKRSAQGKSIFTGAHMVNDYCEHPGNNKFERVCWLITQIWEKTLEEIVQVVLTASSLEAVYHILEAQAGIGGFLAYEMASDIVYMGINLNLNEDDWTHAGPGCERGLKIIFPNATRLYSESLIHRLRNEQHQHFERLRLPFQLVAYQGKDLSLRSVEHMLCEFSKFWKAKQGTGRPKNRFTPTTGPSLSYCLPAWEVTR